MEEAQRNGHQLRTTGTGPASTADSAIGEDAPQHRIQQQEEEDDRLLLDAGIEVDDMGEEEKRQILEALRQSLPAPKNPCPHASHQAPMSDEDNTREEDSPKSAEEPPPPQQTIADEDNPVEIMEVQEGPPHPAQTLEDRDNSQEMMELEQEMASPVQSLEVIPLTYDSEEEDGGQECDSTTVTVPVSDNWATAAGLIDPRGETGLALEVKECDQVAGGDPSDSDSTSDMDTDMLTRSRKNLGGQQCPDMRLSSLQKEQGQSRFKELFNRTRLSQSQGWEPSQSAGEDGQSGNRSVHSSQDLFQEHSPNEEHGSSTQPDHSSIDAASRTRTSHSASPTVQVTRSTPSPSSPPREKRSSPGDREEKERECLEDAETLPPEDFEAEEEEGEHQGPCGDKEADSGRRSPVYPMQVTQVSCSSPSPDAKTHAHRYFLTPSKLPVEDDDDDRPLLHDNWFSWPPVPPVCCLHRTYRTSSRKRQEVVPDTKPYFCPQRESVAAYSEVIACMLDSYLQKFTTVQRQLHTLLPWGKPVRAGMHQSGSLDVRKRGQLEFKAFGLEEEEEDDDDDFQIAKRPQQKAITLRRKRKISDDDIPGEAEADTKVKVEVDVDEGEGHVAVTLDDGGDAAADAAVYDAETQPLDSDSELPDLHIEQDSGANSTWGAKAQEEEKVKAPSPTLVSEDSQSSSSLLNEQGDLYSTQLPRRKRTGRVDDREVTVMRVKRPRRVAYVAETKENSPEKLRPLSRKRKQVPSSSVDSKVYLVSVNDDDQEEEDGASFPPIKVLVEKKRRGYVHISSRGVGGEGKAVTVQPAPGGSQSPGGRSGPAALLEEKKDGKPNPQPCGSSNVSSSSHVPWGAAGGGGGEEDSDDSVQYLDPPPGYELAPPARIGRQRAGQDDQLEEEEDQEDGGHKAVSAARLHAQEPEESAEEPSEELITCPLCNKQFPSSVIERHASDCSLEMEREEPPALHHSTGPLSIPPASQLRRRPLRGQLEREDDVCALCHVRQQGRAALKRHFEQCRQKYEKEEASSSSGHDLPVDTRRVYPTRAAHSNWVPSYRIPRKVEGAATATRVSRQALPRLAEEEDDVIEEESNDSDKDPPFRPSEEDRQQEKDDLKENRPKKRVGAAREHR